MSLDAAEPYFRAGIQRLESANHHPKTDIRLSAEVMQETHNKLRALGLDPRDTTPKELYQVLQARIATDDKRLTQSLRTRAALYVSAEGNVIEGMLHALKDSSDSKRCFALKHSVLKSMLKSQPPKKAMKKLGYRSVDSLLKNESAVAVLAGAWLVESVQWQSKLLDQYKKLKPSDFESRSISVTHLQFKKWDNLADEVVVTQKHNVLSFRELGALVLLPLPKQVPPGAVTASLTLALHELNEIRASSTFLKLSQVRHDFGTVVRMVAADQAQLSSQLLDQPVPWHLIQRYYARSMHHFREAVFEPHVQADDITWHPVEQALSAIEPSMAFWHNSAHLGLLHGRHAVSCNVVDVALNYVNQVPFEHRISQYFKYSLWHELLLRYLQHTSVEQSVLHDLQPKLATELALA
jgi:hypothetical protein